MPGTSSAEPEQLSRFADGATELDLRLIGEARDLGEALHALRASGSWQLPPLPAVEQRLDIHARGAFHDDAWVGRVGEGFRQADLLGGFGRLLGLPAIADDLALARAVNGLHSGLTPDQWRQRAYELAGIDPASWDPSSGLGANDATVQEVYALYGQLMLDHPELQWAGMAHIAGGLFYAGWQDLYVAGQLADPAKAIRDLLHVPDVPGPIDDWVIDRVFGNLAGAFVSYEIDWFLEKFLTMQKKIFDDLAWQHVAYAEGGIAEMRRLNASGQLSDELVQVWEDIASGDPARVQAGNTALLQREQQRIIQPDYQEMRDHHGPVGEIFTLVLTWTAQSPIPGGRPYGDVVHTTYDIPKWACALLGGPAGLFICPSITVPDGNIASYDDRWQWISNDMLPAYQRLVADDPARLHDLLETPVSELADGHRRIPLPYDPH